MGGMPSARGVEWKGRGSGERKRFQESFERIPRNPDGSMVFEPPAKVQDVPIQNPPSTCNECFFVKDCPTECSLGSIDCRKRLGI